MIGVASGSFQPVAACYGLLRVVSLVTIGGAIFHYRSGQVVLQSRPGVTKWRNFYNKVVQVLQIGAIIKSRAVQKANEIIGNR